MTNSPENKNDRLDRVESIIESNSRAIQAMLDQRETDRNNLEEVKQIVVSNSRTIQAMLDQREIGRAHV